MDYFLVILFIIFMFAATLLQIVSLPGNWIAIIFLVIWKFIGPDSATHELNANFFMLIVGIAALGELMEWVIQLKLGKKMGSTGKGSIGGIIGSIVGSILMLPLFFGFGALIGALLGAFVGCLIFELMGNRPRNEAVKAAWGVFVGRFLGMGLKLGLGIAILWMTILHIWPSAPEAIAMSLISSCC
ncbi:MAG: DUF456 domain-containing protein [Desulfovibrionaceae bacterium]|nr:DUF456 domain-containing protein [Desulfovibrionaceae bacterium]